MFSIDPTEAAAAEAVELATDSTAEAERGAAAAARERAKAEQELAAALTSRGNDALAVKKAYERLAAAAAAVDAAKAAGGAAKGDMSSALTRQAPTCVRWLSPHSPLGLEFGLGLGLAQGLGLGLGLACATLFPPNVAGGDGGGCGG